MPNVRPKPPKALPALPTPPTDAPEPPSAHAAPGPKPLSIDEIEAMAHTGEDDNAMVHALSRQHGCRD